MESREHAGGFGRGETRGCDRDLEAMLMALEAVSQDKKTNKTTAKVVD